MQRRKKQLLGLFGLGLVAVTTLLAGTMPAEEASAARSDNTTIQVKVLPTGPGVSVGFQSLNANDVVVNKEFDVSIEYRNATNLELLVRNNRPLGKDETPFDAVAGSEGSWVSIPLNGTSCAEEALDSEGGVCTAVVTLPGDLAGQYGVGFSAMVKAAGRDGSSASDDVAFKYLSAYVEYNGKSDGSADKNPLAEIVLNDKVTKFILQATEVRNGNKVFGDGLVVTRDEAGNYTTNVSGATISVVTDGNGSKTVEVGLPFKQAGAASGNYVLTMVAYNGDDVVAMDTAKQTIRYNASTNTHTPGKPSDPSDPNQPGGPSGPGGPSNPNDPNNPDDPNNPNDPNNPGNSDDPNSPNVPGTGSNLFKDLNISQADYIVTGLVAFGMVTAFAVFLIIRRNKR